jgi:hypothetical protein
MAPRVKVTLKHSFELGNAVNKSQVSILVNCCIQVCPEYADSSAKYAEFEVMQQYFKLQFTE